jgi:hypothetical protein
MAAPLIIQIQEATLDTKSSITDALRKAKLACTKLSLTEFGNWVDLELNGYMGKRAAELPEYRKLHGVPQAYSPYQGWQPIVFKSTKPLKSVSFAPVGMPISAIESLVRSANSGGVFHFPYPPELHQKLMESLNWGPSNIQIQLGHSQVVNVIDAVRNMLLDWTIEMEKQGILGNDLIFTPEDRMKAATTHPVNHIHIGKVGAFVQHADRSVVQGGIESVLGLTEGVRNLVEQVEQLLPAANLPVQVQKDTHAALGELRTETASTSPDIGRLQRGLESLKRVLSPAGEHLVKIAVDAAVTKLLGPG